MEYFPPVTETQNRLSNYISGPMASLRSVKTVTNSTIPTKRIRSAAWIRLQPNVWGHKTVLRGGFGILYDRPFGTLYSNVRQDTPFFAQAGICCFFDPGAIVGPPPGSNIQYALGGSRLADSYPPIQILLSAWLPTEPSAASRMY